MRKVKRYYPVRFSLDSLEDYENFRKMETLLVVQGVSITDYWGSLISEYVSENGVLLEGKVIGGLRELLELCEREGLDEIYLQIIDLLRQKWEIGVDYWETQNNERKIYRYDLDRCLEKCREYAKWRKEKELVRLVKNNKKESKKGYGKE